MLATFHDRPVESSTHDALNREAFISTLINGLIVRNSDIDAKVDGPTQSTGLVIGLTGEWGSGKSSVFNLVKEKLSSLSNVAVVSFNPWLVKDGDQLIRFFFEALRSALGATLRERATELLEQVDRYKGALELGGGLIGLGLDTFGLGGGTAAAAVLKPAFNAVKGPKAKSAEDERRILEEKISEASIAVVVLIDELDRVEDTEVREVARLIKAVGDIKGISYLVAYDQSRVAKALGRGSTEEELLTSGQAYLEKIVQLSIPIRPLFEHDIRELLLAKLPSRLSEMTKEYQRLIIDNLVSSIKTPRDIGRLLNAFSVLQRLTDNEVCPFEVLAYAWLQIKSPLLRDAISNNYQRLVTDPSEREAIRRVLSRGNNEQHREGLVDVLGKSAAPFLGLLELLFPRFSGDAPTDELGMRIQKRRNLVRLLYLGDPPWSLSIAELRSIWESSTSDEKNDKLASALNGPLQTELVDRLRDNYESLSKKYENDFWTSFSRSLIRPNDWATGQEMTGSLIDDGAKVLWRFGTRTEQGRARVKGLFDVLSARGDVLITPWLLRREMHVQGYSVHSRGELEEGLFTRDEMIALLDLEIPRYIESIRSGFALRRVPDSEMIYAVSNAGRWTPTLRDEFTDQLDTSLALATLAALLVPPGYISSRKSMDELLRSDVILERVRTYRKRGEWPEDPWLRVSLARLEATLNGDESARFIDSVDGIETLDR